VPDEPLSPNRSLELDDQIGLDGKDGYPLVYCSFDEDQFETAEELEPGKTVTFKCVGSDNWSSGHTLKHCVLISAWSERVLSETRRAGGSIEPGVARSANSGS